VVADLQAALNLPAEALGWLTSSVQFGFISGTLVFAALAVADRIPARGLFLICAVLAALANLGLLMASNLSWLLFFRYLTGFFLAGIYPVGMKIAASWYDHDLGKAIGFLVGALVVGTAFPHLLRALGAELPWQFVLGTVSVLATVGGFTLFFTVPEGPFHHSGAHFQPKVLLSLFAEPDFRAAALGYFGHMWELYTFWAFVPFWLTAYMRANPNLVGSVSLVTFAVIAIGALGCVAGGLWSLRVGSGRVAFTFLAISGTCCLLSPLLFAAPPMLFFPFLFIWGIAVIGDSGQFSALTARTAPRQWIGSALTLVTCLGFSLTIVSIELTNVLSTRLDPAWLLFPLAIGPAVGLRACRRLGRRLD